MANCSALPLSILFRPGSRYADAIALLEDPSAVAPQHLEEALAELEASETVRASVRERGWAEQGTPRARS